MSTGIQPDSTLSEFYNNEFKKESNKGRYIILKISDDKKFIQPRNCNSFLDHFIRHTSIRHTSSVTLLV